MPSTKSVSAASVPTARYDLSVLLTVPMNCGVNRQVILDKHFKVISFVNINEGTGILAINKIDLATDTVYTTCQLSSHAR